MPGDEDPNRLAEPWWCPECGWPDDDEGQDWLPSINRHTSAKHGWVYDDGPGTEKVPYEPPEPDDEPEEEPADEGGSETYADEENTPNTSNGSVDENTVRRIVQDELGNANGDDDLTIDRVRQVALNMAKDVVMHYRRKVLEDFGITLLEGRVDKRQNAQDSVRIRIDHTDIDELLHHYLDTGDHVRVLVELVDEDEARTIEDRNANCQLCQGPKEDRSKPYCQDCWEQVRP